MAIYQTSDQFYSTMRALFDRLSAEPDGVAQFRKSGVAIRVRVTDPDAVITLNSRHLPSGVVFGPSNGRVDLELTLPADTLHRIWLGQTRLRDALARGEIQVKGIVLKALLLAPLFQRAETLYPEILQAQGIAAQ